MSLSLIIVNYKTADLVLDCIGSLSLQDRRIIGEIIVVDNHSQDGLKQKLAERFSDVVFIDAGYNAGFARANNMGIRKASGDSVLLLNSDTVVTGDAVAECYRRLMDSDYYAAGVQLINPDKSPQISGNFVMRGGLNYLLPLPYLGRFLRFMALAAGAKRTNVPEATSTVEVDWINGAFLMVKKSVIEKAGLLDEDFFLYAEEAEWCSRIRRQGKLCIYGDLRVIHLQGVSAGAAFKSKAKGYMELSDAKGLQVMVSNFLRLRKEFGLFWLFFQYTFYLLTIPVWFLCALIDLSLFSEKGCFGRWAGFSSNVFRLAGWLPRMVSGRPYFYKVL